ncbi:MAG: outer membrane beta-barrel protein [Bacteroidetes bacterium]|nr:outer membrane beta-barrel protein [Bacteroidota bacterium]
MTKSIIKKGKAGMFALSLFLISATSINAQTSYHIGFVGGPQFTMLSSDRGTYTGKIGYYGGLTNEFRMGEKLSFEIDGLYSIRGGDAAYKDSIPGFYDHYVKYKVARSFTTTYFDIHALLKYNIMLGHERIIPYDRPGKTTFISLYAGPYYGSLMGFSSVGKTDTTYTYKINPDSQFSAPRSDKRTFSSTDAWKKTRGNKLYDPILSTDVGIAFGAGMYFMVGDRGTLHVDVRGQWGLGTIDNDAFGHKSVEQNDDPTQVRIVYNYANISHIAVQLGVGASVRLFGKGPNRNF